MPMPVGNRPEGESGPLQMPMPVCNRPEGASGKWNEMKWIFKIIPFFDKYKIIGVKLQDYLDFKRVAELMKTKDHLTTLGFPCIWASGKWKKIKEIKEGMNKGI